MKEKDSTSWFNLIKRILLKYSLQRPLEYLSNPMLEHLVATIESF
jgi:hypothetical protein